MRVALAFVGLLVAVAVLGPALSPYGPDVCRIAEDLQGPSRRHWLGTDADGCDLASLLARGTRLSLVVGIAVVSVSAFIGTAVGLIAGLRGGWVDHALMLAVETLQAFPGFLVALTILALAPKPSAAVVVLALCVSGWVGYARMVRGQVLVLRETDYILAARSLGWSERAIAWRELLPNVLPQVAVLGSFGLAGAVLAEAGLSFLGLGVPPGTASWGAMLQQARSYLLVAPWLSVPPGMAIGMTVLAFNLLGDRVRDRLDPTCGSVQG